MNMSELTALRLSTRIVSLGAGLWLTGAVTGGNLSLDDLIGRRVEGRLDQRKARRFLEDVADVLAEHLITSTTLEFPSLTHEEKDLIASSVASILDQAPIRDEPIVSDTDLATIERRVRAVSDRPENSFGLSADALRFREYLIQESCVCIVSIAKTLPDSRIGAFSELLRRDAQILDQIHQVIKTLPGRTSDVSNDEFELHYRRTVTLRLDQMELFGVTIDEASRRYPLATAYVALTAKSNEGSYRTDDFLRQTQRLLLLGDAGTGKSTFLRWIGVRAACRSFSSDLNEWNSFIPFYIPLRIYVHTDLPRPAEFVAPIGGPMTQAVVPAGWVNSVLVDGRSCVLIDGVDELPVERLPEIGQWLSELVESFPDVRYVVTARQTGTGSNWLQHIGFKEASLQPMLESEMRELIVRWYQTAAMERSAELQPFDSALFRRQLTDLISVSRDLQELATNPLLCALLCALYLRSWAHLPADKLQFYDAAIDMLLERRDAERLILTYRARLSREEKLLVLRDLAYWLMRNDSSHISRDQAINRIGHLTRSAHSEARPDTVLEDILQRSGMLYESASGEVSFIYHSFQEYLAAGEAVFLDDIDFLVESAGIERYRNVVILAAGQANVLQSQRLILGIIRQADEHLENKRYLILLALSCAGNAPALDARTVATMRSYALQVLPPRTQAEEHMLAEGGSSVLAWLQTMTGALSASYEKGTSSVEEVQTEINRFWREMQTSAELEAEVAAAGFNRNALTQAKEVPITVRAESSGVDPVTVVLTITFAPSVSRTLKDLWTTVLLPRIRRRLGDDAIGAESRVDVR